MNQILETNNKKFKFRKIFKIQFIISFMTIIILFIYVLNENNKKNKENEITKIASQNAKVISLFESYKITEDYNNIYFCTLKIEKINLEYFVYKNYSEENLKILPCKFSGENLENNSNICIIGHNYFDNRFFGNLDKLEVGDKIILESLDKKNYEYYITNIYEIHESNIYEVTKNENNSRTVTLCTCTNQKNMRLVVRAKAL